MNVAGQHNATHSLEAVGYEVAEHLGLAIATVVSQKVQDQHDNHAARLKELVLRYHVSAAF